MKKILLAFLLCSNLYGTAQQNTIVREYKKVFTTYPFSDPDPVPNPASKIYPYFRFDGFTDKPVKKEWKVVELENDFIRIMILPEIGGKIWSATEKSTGKEFIYYNHVIKFRDIAMRGPWTSGGIEANYGIIGHTPGCATPVDYTIVKKEDGSISCVIGLLDLLTRTSWRLDINLPKDKAYITTSSFWSNTTAQEQPYYTWMNTGIKAAGNLEFVYPGKNYLGHEGEYSDWPINKKNGRDLRFYENNNFGGYKSYHVFGKYTNFFGGYWHNDEFGMARYSNHDDKPGKKIWIWGLSQQGMIWEKLLTDTDGQYVEVQSGRLFNQSAENSMLTPFKHRSFAPYQSDAWTEYWFPVKQTRGFVKANPYGAINVLQENGWLKIYFSPLQKLDDKLEVFDNGKAIYSKNISLQPMVLFADSVQVAADKNKLRVILGENKLVWDASPEEGDLQRPLEIPKDFDHNSVYGLYLQGKNYISFRDYIKAAEKLTACLQKDPGYAPALYDMAAIKIRQLKNEEAKRYAGKALAINTYDPAANYYYALANKNLGDYTNAKDGFDIAAADEGFRGAAYTELAKIYFITHEEDKAAMYAQKALLSNQNNIEALQILAVLYRHQKNEAAAKNILNHLAATDPLNHFVDFEKYCWMNSLQSKTTFINNIRSELPQQTFLELGIWYYQLQCNEDALKVLAMAEPNAEILYWKAFLQNKPVDVSTVKAATDFPFRAETAAVLQSLLDQKHTNQPWLLQYHLALIQWSRNEMAAAKELFNACGNTPDDPNFYAARAALFNDDAKASETDLLQAIKLDAKQWRYPKLLAEHYIALKENEKAFEVAAAFYKTHADNYVMGMLYAKTLLLNKQYAMADALLTRLNILPFEGATAGRQLYHEAKLMQAAEAMKKQQYKKALQFIASAKLWPANLGVGKPYQEDLDERLEDWMTYNCLIKLDKTVLAKQALDKVLAFEPKVDNTVKNFLPANQLITAWAMEKTTTKENALHWLQQQSSLYPGNKVVQWALQVFQGNSTALPAEEKDGEVRIIEQLNN